MMNFTDKDEKGSTDNNTNIQDRGTREIIVLINCPLMLISILGNALVLAAIRRTPSIYSTSMMLLCSLAVSDLLVGLIAQPIFIADLLTNEVLIKTISVMVGFSACSVTLCTITAISVDRFMALHYHMRYAQLITKSRVRYTVLAIWFSNALLSSSYLMIEQIYKLAIVVITMICLIISTFCYILIYRIVRRHQFHMYTQEHAVKSSTGGNGADCHMGRLKKSALNTFVFYIFLILCYFPVYILLLLYGLSYISWKIEFNFASTIVFMNSSINPFLYCWHLRELRTAVVKTGRWILCKQTAEN